MQLKLPRRRAWRAAIYIFSTLLMLLAIDLVLVQLGRRVTPGYDITRITEPTLPDGRIDYLTAIENVRSAGVTPENNAAPLILQAFGRGALPRNQPRDGITSRLGMAPLPDTGDYFQLRDAYLEHPNLSQADPANSITGLMEQSWKASAHPRTAAWLAANEKPLALLTQAASKPVFFIPFNGGAPPELFEDLQLPHLHLMRDGARALTCRAMLRAGKGDFAAARDDLLAVHNLARLLDQPNTTTLIDRLVAWSAIDELASFAETALANEGTLDASQARQWLSALRGIGPIHDFSDVLDRGERYMFLQLMQYASVHGLDHAVGRVDAVMREASPLWGVTQAKEVAANVAGDLVPVRIGRIMRQGNEWEDRFVAAAGKPAGPQRRQAVAAAEADFNANGPTNRPWASMRAWGWPNFSKIVARADQAQAKRNLAVTAMALCAYRAERNAYPPTLEALKSADLPAIPDDPFTGGSLIYRSAGGRYTLYSVGPNLQDDQGANDDIAAAKPQPATGPATSR